MEDNEKKEKPVKVPGVFKKPIKEKKFNKHFVKYIEHLNDRKFFIECFEKLDDTYVIRNNLTKDEVKKLNSLLSWVKKNRKGPVKVVPMVFAGAIAAALVMFFTVFANPLLGNAIEKALEAIFEAKADVRNFRFSLIDFEISMNSVTVANKDAPMTNLFEIDRTIISLKPEAVLRGKVWIEEIRADAIRFGTPRTTSGALPARTPREKREREPRQPSEAPPLVDLQNFDAMALLNQEFDKLNTPRLYDEAIAAYNETLTKWQGQVDSARGTVEELRTASQPLININVNNIRDVETIRQTIQDVNNMVSTVQSAADEASRLVSGLESDINTARLLEQNARNAITNDINHLKSYIDINSGAAFAAIEPFIRDILSDSVDQYIEYGLVALEILEKVKLMAEARPREERPPRERKVRFTGRDVNFPVAAYPKFYLGTLASDFTIDTWNWAFDLRDISSNPDLTNRPVSLTFGLTETGSNLARQVAFAGNADFRTNRSENFNATLNGSGFPLHLGDQLGKVGINGFSGQTSFSMNMTGHNNGGVSAGGDIEINQARLIDPRGTIAEATAEAVRQAGNINLGLQYRHHPDRRDEFTIDTNIGDLIAQALRRIVEAYAQIAIAEIERALREKIDQYIDGRLSSEQVDLLLRTARGDMTAINNMRDQLINKRNEFEQGLRSMANEVIQQTMDDARQQAGQAVQDIRQGQTPSIQAPAVNVPAPTTPSLPGGGGSLRLPGR
jgi:uncharacterized protein (TIGR03545 family)